MVGVVLARVGFVVGVAVGVGFGPWPGLWTGRPIRQVLRSTSILLRVPRPCLQEIVELGLSSEPWWGPWTGCWPGS